MNIRKLILAVLLAILLPISTVACDDDDIGKGGVIRTEASGDSNCNFNDNLSESADSFISRCRKGGIRREFPSEYNNVTLREIKRDKSDDGKKAYKLLNDRRFRK